MVKLLFVCSSNLDRSPCAESLFENSKHEAKSCGTNPWSETVISKEAILWADVIFCMEHIHKQFIYENFSESFEKEVVVLNVPNTLCRNDLRLEKMLREKLKDYL